MLVRVKRLKRSAEDLGLKEKEKSVAKESKTESINQTN